MKKLLLMGLLGLSAVCAHAQLQVFKNGTAQVGTSGVKISDAISPLSATLNPGSGDLSSSFAYARDSIASLTLFHPTNNYGNGAYITFGSKKNVSIGESPNINQVLNLFSQKGIEYYMGTSRVFGFYTRPNNVFTFYSDVKASSFLTDSDSRLKSDVAGLDGLGSSLTSITPVSYKLTSTPEAETTSTAAKANSTTELTMEEGMTEIDIGNIYALIIDGAEIDSRKMILTD